MEWVMLSHWLLEVLSCCGKGLGKSEMNSILKKTMLFPWGLYDKLQNGVSNRAILLQLCTQALAYHEWVPHADTLSGFIGLFSQGMFKQAVLTECGGEIFQLKH